MSEHTELPWNVSDIDEYGGYDCMTDAIHVGPIDIDARRYGQSNAGDDDYDKEKMLADARLISVSVNNHERLVESLRNLTRACNNVLVSEEQHWIIDQLDDARTLLAALEAEKGGEL